MRACPTCEKRETEKEREREGGREKNASVLLYSSCPAAVALVAQVELRDMNESDQR